MNFVARHINAIGILLLMSFAAAAAGLYWNVPQQFQKSVGTQTSVKQPDTSPSSGIELQQPAASSAAPVAPTAEAGCPMHRNKGDAASPAPSVEAGCNHSEDSGDGCCSKASMQDTNAAPASGCTRHMTSPATPH